MAELNPAASHDLPSFITAPGETDVLMVFMTVFLVFAVVGFGVVFLRLHTLPERIAHKSHKIQFEIVAVLGLIALFTHMHIFWIAGLLLALIDMPDFGTSLGRIADSTEKMAGIQTDAGAEAQPESTADVARSDDAPGARREPQAAPRENKGADVRPAKPDIPPRRPKELRHA
jgi:hypothetical protein